jgi:serine/threonine protein kinase
MEESKQHAIPNGVVSNGNSAHRKIENPDRKISDFKILRVIGVGTFGKVYLALSGTTPVAIKVLRKSTII